MADVGVVVVSRGGKITCAALRAGEDVMILIGSKFEKKIRNSLVHTGCKLKFFARLYCESLLAEHVQYFHIEISVVVVL